MDFLLAVFGLITARVVPRNSLGLERIQGVPLLYRTFGMTPTTHSAGQSLVLMCGTDQLTC
jgi:hypothetical protein